MIAAGALAVGGLIGGLIGAAVADPRTDIQRRIDQMQVAEVQRDAAQVLTLTDQARRVLDLLGPVVEQLATALPPGGTAGPVADQGKVDGWKAVTRKGAEEFANPPSAGTAVNIARGSLAAGARQLDLAVDTYAAAVKAAEPDRPALLTLAGRQRDTAVATWSVGATQLDLLNVDTGRGHQHVFLPSAPGQQAMTSDGSEEGN
ncbi:hypothetical protein GCM10010170_022480 [Dactylosporangium salmoneum]|uniref:Uncharacterized protein n=1 Tax=Dactylosporangium salmoneum TaxID=53361 RepID=A0ABN3FXS8_9ACTN